MTLGIWVKDFYKEHYFLLTSIRTNITAFDIVDRNGTSVASEDEGLLIYKDGTVCDDSFSDHSADAICIEMGFNGALSWGTGNLFDIQPSARNISMDDVACNSNVWAECSFTDTPNCRHSEDIYITCEEGKLVRLTLS